MRSVVIAVISVLSLINITAVTSRISPWYPEHCKYYWLYKCGDTCVDYKYRCNCGGEDWDWWDNEEEEKYCCIPPGTKCTKDIKDPDGWGKHNVSCPSGELLPWYQSCHNNDCEGSPVIIKNNCQYDCLARTDESPDNQNDKKINQDYNLQSCNDTWNNPSLKYEDGECKPNYKWCTEDIDSCNNELSRDKLQPQRLCQNSTFWESQDCNDYWRDGTVYRYGERCRGRQQHCYYPAYLQYDYKTYSVGSLLPQCKDKSDQIFERLSHCNMSAHLDIYCDKCYSNKSHSGWQLKNSGDCEFKCNNREQWISYQTEQQKNDTLDPHNCQASCSEPKYNCLACQNPSYFDCTSSTECLHPDLVCDGVPQCPGGEDEIFEMCKEKNRKEKVFRSDAIMKCQSIFQPNVTIFAVPCDKITECHEGEDETWVCRYTNIISYGFFGTIIGIVTVFIILKFKNFKKKTKEIQFGKCLVVSVTDFHTNPLTIFPFLAVNSGAKQKEILKTLTEEEMKINRSEFKLMLWLKNNYSKFEISVMAEYVYPSFLKKCFPFIETFEKLTESHRILWWVLHMVWQISFTYLDLVKDLLITFTVLVLIGGLSTLLESPTAFPSVVVMLFLMSIILPLFLSSLQLARDGPDIILGEDFYTQSRLKQNLGRVRIVLMSFINPALLIQAYETNLEKLKFQDLKNLQYVKIMEIGRKGERILRQYVKYLRTELGFETSFQIVGQIILLLQSSSSSSTVAGLEEVFGAKDSTGMGVDAMITLSILWSMKTCVTLHLKAAKIEKTHLGVFSKMFLVLTSLFSYSSKILSIIAFFSGSLGLFSLLNHYKLEQIPFRQSKEGKLMKYDQMKFGNKTFTWGEIDRWTYDYDGDTYTGTPPGYKRYTLFTLAGSFHLFWILIFLQFLAVYMVKVAKSKKFREADKLDKLIHSTENMTVAFPLEDFDVLNGSAREHRERFEKVNVEVLLTMLVNFLIHMLMLGPLWYTASQVISRHELLLVTIGVREEEKDSYKIAQYLPIVMTSAVVLTSLLALISFLLYNYKFHPWSILIQDPDDSTISPEEDIKYKDIYIPVPYDPEIPGVRCVDVEEVDNVDVAMANIDRDIHDEKGQETDGENIELQDL